MGDNQETLIVEKPSEGGQGEGQANDLGTWYFLAKITFGLAKQNIIFEPLNWSPLFRLGMILKHIYINKCANI